MPMRCAASRTVSPRSQATSWPSMVRSTWSGRACVRVMSSTVVAIVPLRFLTAAATGCSMPERTLTASNLHTWRQVSHLMQLPTSMTCSCFFSPLMQLVGHFLAQSMQPVQASASM